MNNSNNTIMAIPHCEDMQVVRTEEGSASKDVDSIPLLIDDHPVIDGGVVPDVPNARVRIVSMTLTHFPCGSACGCDRPDYGKPILTIEEAAKMLGIGKKRLEDIIYEEKVRLGHLPNFVCNAGGKIQRRIIRDEFLEWVKLGQAKRGRPAKQLR